MKKRSITTLILTATCILFSACSGDSERLLNAENYKGMALEQTQTARTITEATQDMEQTTESADQNIDATQATTADSTTGTTTGESVYSTTESAGTRPAVTINPATTRPIATTNPTTTRPVATTNPATTRPATTTASSSTPPPAVHNPSGTNTYTALNHDKVYGVWISYIELGSVLMGKSESAFRSGFSTMMDNCKDFGINTIYLQVRPFGDAVYKSELFPWSKYASGNIGTNPGFDPLHIMIEEAHKRNISVHAWINPLRLSQNSDMIKIDSKFKTGEWYNNSRRGDYIVKVGDYWYLNPAHDAVRSLITAGAAEIIANYNVDGLHIDDYFYPTTDASFDEIAFKAGNFDSLSKFRFDNINKLVRELKQSTKKANSTALFGISPQGSVENNLNHLYADVNLWSNSTEYCDYIVPQIYYGFKNQAQPYEECLAKWVNMTRNSSVKLIAGLAVYKIGKEDKWAGNGKDEWQKNTDIIARQISTANQKNIDGVCFFSYSHLFGTESQTQAIQAEKKAISSL